MSNQSNRVLKFSDLEEAWEAVGLLNAECLALRSSVGHLNDHCDELEQALLRYGDHEFDCARRDTATRSSACDCGFEDVLKRAGL